ncbi:hypothetical protein [Ornithinimicrobium kibberense]|uniref:hypothetical protein n=1 Tax=Ornithinimicrobium kibberense TaxID=282060 RepID=UPI00360DE3A2
MSSSAAASSSPVLTPAAARPRTRARVSATTSPARRMARSWSGVLASMEERRRKSDIGSAAGQDRPAEEGRTASIRAVTSSTVPMPSTTWSSPRSR